ncbi:hypothetical protein GCWU000282_00556 [Catonella morbi ATCC 51271]|uniref:Uncharacterized protein n=1 Tax=Catonella morbi ATCC 51271 TaxID=592026 RepID=V2Y5J5_9FIRM|nr:hypothetical protein GCWU000282_00556 [Catonella morbi ATCC 51271]
MRQTSLPRAVHPSGKFLFNRKFQRKILLSKKACFRFPETDYVTIFTLPDKYTPYKFVLG